MSVSFSQPQPESSVHVTSFCANYAHTLQYIVCQILHNLEMLEYINQEYGVFLQFQPIGRDLIFTPIE